jgi:hypothetical protein
MLIKDFNEVNSQNYVNNPKQSIVAGATSSSCIGSKETNNSVPKHKG